MPLFKSKFLRWTSILRFVALVSAFGLVSCSPLNSSFLDPYGPVAAAQRQLFLDVIAWMMIVVVPVFILVPLFAWRYRRRNATAQYRPDWTFSWPLEIAIWGVPVAIVVILSAIVITRENRLDPYATLPSQAPPLDVQVVGLDWKWLFIYPEQRIATVGELGVPEGRAVRFRLTSDSVMQSFFIPALGSQIYAMAGMVTKLHLKADRIGRLRGRNTQFNGTGFQHQTFGVSVMSQRDFSAWVEKVRALGKPLDPAVYDQLSRKGTAAEAHERLGMTGTPRPVLYFSSVAPHVFRGIVDKYRHIAKSGRQQEGRDAR